MIKYIGECTQYMETNTQTKLMLVVEKKEEENVDKEVCPLLQL